MGVNLCFIARVADGMLLVASTDPMRSSDSQETMDVYKSQARQILAGLTERSPSKCSIDSGPFSFHYVMADDVVYLAMTPKSYPKRAIFRYLGEVAQEFAAEVTQECGGGDWRAYERPSEAGGGPLGSPGVEEFHVPALHALVTAERVPRATSGPEPEPEATGARQLFGGGDRPISSRREPEPPKASSVFRCSDTLLMLQNAKLVLSFG